MATTISQELAIAKQAPLDVRYGSYSGDNNDASTPGSARYAACQAIPSTRRFAGLTVLLDIDGVGKTEYWWRDGILDSNLAQKFTTDGTPVELTLDAALDVTSNNGVENTAVTAALILDTNKAITRDFSTLNGETLNVNTSLVELNSLGKVVDFIKAVFFPFVKHTISIVLAPSATIREVGTSDDITITGNLGRNNTTDIATRNIQKSQDGGAYANVIGSFDNDSWSALDDAAVKNDTGYDTYKVSCVIASDEEEVSTEPIEATRTVNYIFPMFIGRADDGVTIDGTAILNAVTISEAVKVVQNPTGDYTMAVGSTSHDLWKAEDPIDDQIRWIAVPTVMGRLPVAYLNGLLNNGNIPGDLFEAAADITIDDPAWGAASAVAYKLIKTSYPTSFDSNSSIILTFE